MLPVTAEKTLTAARATETYSTNAYPARYSNYPRLTDKCDVTLEGCTTTGYVGISRAVAPRKGAAEKTPATPFPREEMAWAAMAAIHIVARILRTNVDHLNPARRLAEPSQLPCRPSTPEIYSPAALLLMARSAHHKQSAKGVLSMGSGAHDRQRSGVIPAQPSQTDLIVA